MTPIIARPKCKAVLLSPVYQHREPETEDTIALALEAFEDKYGHGIIRRMPCHTRTLVQRSRNLLVHDAEKLFDAEYYIFYDGDHFFPTGDVAYWRSVTQTTLPERFGKINFLERILSHGPEYRIIGGAYKDRKRGVEYQCDPGHNERGWNERMNRGEFRGLYPVKWIATGASRYHVPMFDELRSKAQTDRTLGDEIRPMVYNREWGFFSMSKHHQVGEDVSMSIRAKEHLGAQSYIDCDLRVGHARKIWVF